MTAITTAADAARELLVRRLVDEHELDEPTARDAVDRYRCGEDGPHHELVHRAGFEVYAELSGWDVDGLRVAVRESARRYVDRLRRITLAMAPVVREMQEHLAAAAAALRNVGVVGEDGTQRRPVMRDRPAWQSPYGPPARRSPRKR
ncbi:hypothetical protein OIU91_28465 [Streptomyces sp. NBC_01456]|uniref:hypothetical protein n=1 Tax=unclassified Streptomyces TaxID=2593676 RepID=UPI002E318AF3|nr:MULTISPECIES: hypothetical protein [unclassified Streptomyces]